MDSKTTYLCTVICPKKLTLAHDMCFKSLNFVALELIFKIRSIRHSWRCRSLKYKQILNVKVIALICGQKKGQYLSSKFPKFGFKATIVYF